MMRPSNDMIEGNLRPLGKRKIESQPLLPRRKIVDESIGCEPDVGERKVARTQLDLSSVTASGKSFGRQMWLVKVPPAVFRAWESIDEDGDLGQLVVRKDKKGGEILELNMRGISTEMTDGKKVALPDYTLKGVRQVTDSLIFSQGEAGLKKGGGAQMHATVVRAYNMQPNEGTKYRSLMQNRMIAATVKQQYVKSTELPKKKTRDINEKHIFDLDQEEDRRKKADALEGESKGPEISWGKKLRMDRGTLRGKIFELFNKQERWTFKELNAMLNQPEEHIKGVLKEISEMHRSGQYRNQYELKAEYRTGSENQLASTVPQSDTKK